MQNTYEFNVLMTSNRCYSNHYCLAALPVLITMRRAAALPTITNTKASKPRNIQRITKQMYRDSRKLFIF